MPDAERSSLLWPTWAQVLATLGSAALPGQIIAQLFLFTQAKICCVYIRNCPTRRAWLAMGNLATGASHS